MRKTVLILMMLVLMLAALPALGEGPDERYRTYDGFIASYAENLEFINRNENRHLISLIFASGDTEGSNRVFTISGDILSCTMYTQKAEKYVVGLIVRLSCPLDLNQNSVSKQDFTTSGYQSYALLMGMRDAETAEERFAIVKELNEGIRGKDRFTMQEGPYTVVARRDGNTVEFTFSCPYWVDGRSVQEAQEAAEAERADEEENAPDEEEPAEEDMEDTEGEDEDSLVG